MVFHGLSESSETFPDKVKGYSPNRLTLQILEPFSLRNCGPELKQLEARSAIQAHSCNCDNTVDLTAHAAFFKVIITENAKYCTPACNALALWMNKKLAYQGFKTV